MPNDQRPSTPSHRRPDASDAGAGTPAPDTRPKDQEQLAPQGYPADRRPTDPDEIEASGLPERDKQYGSDDN